MRLIEVENITTKGGSIRVTVQAEAGSGPVDGSVQTHLARENTLGLDRPEYFRFFLGKIDAIKRELHVIVDRCRAAGKEVAGYGVSVGTLAFLTQFHLTRKIDFLSDDGDVEGKYAVGPGYDIPIVLPKEFAARKAGVTIVFAWRYADPIAAKASGTISCRGQVCCAASKRHHSRLKLARAARPAESGNTFNRLPAVLPK